MAAVNGHNKIITFLINHGAGVGEVDIFVSICEFYLCEFIKIIDRLNYCVCYMRNKWTNRYIVIVAVRNLACVRYSVNVHSQA